MFFGQADAVHAFREREVERGQRVPAGVAGRDGLERRMRLAAHQAVHELAAGRMAEQVDVLAVGDFAPSM
ncbi:hypothetical protein G6F62_015643 [Rhizopus arrhizus]|nr:hypothetical protein G6F62_015643 [Rhizopus arrhizus]